MTIQYLVSTSRILSVQGNVQTSYIAQLKKPDESLPLQHLLNWLT